MKGFMRITTRPEVKFLFFFIVEFFLLFIFYKCREKIKIKLKHIRYFEKKLVRCIFLMLSYIIFIAVLYIFYFIVLRFMGPSEYPFVLSTSNIIFIAISSEFLKKYYSQFEERLEFYSGDIKKLYHSLEKELSKKDSIHSLNKIFDDYNINDLTFLKEELLLFVNNTNSFILNALLGFSISASISILLSSFSLKTSSDISIAFITIGIFSLSISFILLTFFSFPRKDTTQKMYMHITKYIHDKSKKTQMAFSIKLKI